MSISFESGLGGTLLGVPRFSGFLGLISWFSVLFLKTRCFGGAFIRILLRGSWLFWWYFWPKSNKKVILCLSPTLAYLIHPLQAL